MAYELILKVAGCTFPNNEGPSRQEILGKVFDDWWSEGLDEEITIQLIPEPDNKYDSTAVIVSVETEDPEATGIVGYVKAEQSRFITQNIRENKIRNVRIEDMGCMRGGIIYVSLKLDILSGDDSPEGNVVIDEDGNAWDEFED